MWGGMLMGGHATKIAGTLTIGVSGNHRGFSAVAGAIAPSIIDGRTLIEVDDDTSSSPFSAVVRLRGFGSDPGIGFLVSIKVGGVTRFGTDATYTFIAPNDGFWVWTSQPFGLAASGSTNFTLITT